jgi:hypothetical protein
MLKIRNSWLLPPRDRNRRTTESFGPQRVFQSKRQPQTHQWLQLQQKKSALRHLPWFRPLRGDNKTMPCHPRPEDWITSPQIPSRFREARRVQALASFFFQPCAPLSDSLPAFRAAVNLFYQHENVSRKRKAPSALGIDTPTIRFRSQISSPARLWGESISAVSMTAFFEIFAVMSRNWRIALGSTLSKRWGRNAQGCNCSAKHQFWDICHDFLLYEWSNKATLCYQRRAEDWTALLQIPSRVREHLSWQSLNHAQSREKLILQLKRKNCDPKEKGSTRGTDLN